MTDDQELDEEDLDLEEIIGQEDDTELPFGDVPDRETDKGIDWSSIDMSSFGQNFEVVEDAEPEPKARKKPKRKVDDLATLGLSRFLRGKSRFVYYVIQPKVRQYTVDKTKPINEDSKITPKDRAKWNKALVKNIGVMSAFLETELLPLTSALSTAVLDSQERYKQLVDDPQAKLPLAFFVKKATLAANLKIVDKICDVMKLSPENRRLMKVEYNHSQPMTPPVPAPTSKPNGKD